MARRPGASHGELQQHVAGLNGDSSEQVGGYLKLLEEKFHMIEKKLPILSKPRARRGRYYIADNFLVSWLAALKPSVDALNFRPLNQLIERADKQLQDVEGHALERLVAQLYEERSRKGMPGFSLSHHVQGYWDSGEVEIDLVAIDEDAQLIRFASIKRDATRLASSMAKLANDAGLFLAAHPRFAAFEQQLAAIAVELSCQQRTALQSRGFIAQDLNDLLGGL